LSIDHIKHCRLKFGVYIQVHDEIDNLLCSRISGVIAFRPTGNEKGWHYCLSYHFGKKINTYVLTVPPRPYEVIDEVHILATAAEKYEGFVFADIDGNIMFEQLIEDETWRTKHPTKTIET